MPCDPARAVRRSALALGFRPAGNRFPFLVPPIGGGNLEPVSQVGRFRTGSRTTEPVTHQIFLARLERVR
jgi:hypothetical protein